MFSFPVQTWPSGKVGQLALRVADSPEKPAWYAESFYSGLSQRVQSAAR